MESRDRNARSFHRDDPRFEEPGAARSLARGYDGPEWDPHDEDLWRDPRLGPRHGALAPREARAGGAPYRSEDARAREPRGQERTLQGRHGEVGRFFGFDESAYRSQHAGWREQLRGAGHELASQVKRVFRAPKGYKRSDERILDDVNERLAHQSWFDPSDIEVAVSAGEVTLRGTVQTRHEKFRAEEIAAAVGGVSDVENLLRIRRDPS